MLFCMHGLEIMWSSNQKKSFCIDGEHYRLEEYVQHKTDYKL